MTDHYDTYTPRQRFAVSTDVYTYTLMYDVYVLTKPTDWTEPEHTTQPTHSDTRSYKNNKRQKLYIIITCGYCINCE